LHKNLDSELSKNETLVLSRQNLPLAIDTHHSRSESLEHVN